MATVTIYEGELPIFKKEYEEDVEVTGEKERNWHLKKSEYLVNVRLSLWVGVSDDMREVRRTVSYEVHDAIAAGKHRNLSHKVNAMFFSRVSAKLEEVEDELAEYDEFILSGKVNHTEVERIGRSGAS